MTIITISGKIYVAYSGCPPDWAQEAIANARAGVDGYAVIDNAPDAEYYEGDDIADWDTTTGKRLTERVVVAPVLTEEQTLTNELATLTAYLATTDWYAIRFADSGEAIPDELKTKRAEARTRISKIRTELEALK